MFVFLLLNALLLMQVTAESAFKYTKNAYAFQANLETIEGFWNSY